MVRKIKDIDVLRETIDKIDYKIVKLLEKRFEIAKKVGGCKLEIGLDIEDKKRERKMLELIYRKTRLPEDFVKKLFTLILDESKKLQMSIK